MIMLKLPSLNIYYHLCSSRNFAGVTFADIVKYDIGNW